MSLMSLSKGRATMVNKWKSWTSRVAKAVEDVLADAQVYVFGSDVDILVVSNSVPEGLGGRARIRSTIEDKAKLPTSHPFEIHIATPEEAKIYLRKAGQDILRLR